MQAKRVAVFGGTFDPIHLGHLSVAGALLEDFHFDEVLFVPAHIAPHKRGQEVTGGIHRYAMLALATQDREELKISTIELDSPDKPYTVETLNRLQEGSTKNLFFIMGGDSWNEITTWRNWEKVLTMVSHLVFTRPGFSLRTDHVTQSLAERIVDMRGWSISRVRDEFNSPMKQSSIYFTDRIMNEISSTTVRNGLKSGSAEIKDLVPKSVGEYIRKYGLYRNWKEGKI
jgi:nicotinate-nucleotide adenylyltransferase